MAITRRLVTSFGGLGAVIGSVLSLLAEWRARRANLSPWDPPRPVPIQRYMRIATASGAAIGLVLALLEAFALA